MVWNGVFSGNYAANRRFYLQFKRFVINPLIAAFCDCKKAYYFIAKSCKKGRLIARQTGRVTHAILA